jgi:hypothetical protein
MGSKEDQKLAVFVTIALVILILGIILFPYPTEAEKMVINSDDLHGYGGPGTYWTSYNEKIAPFHSENYTSGVFTYLYLENTVNESIAVWMDLRVFDSESDCNDYFLKYFYVPGLQHGGSVGDDSVSWYSNDTYAGFRLIFIKDEVCVDIHVMYWAYSEQRSYDPLTIAFDLAHIQLQKIDQYLAQHPGAS